MSANCEAPAATNDSVSRNAEVAATEQTEKLEHTEELSSATGPEEVLEKVQKQLPAVRRARGPFDATQSTSTSDVAAGHCHVEELMPRPESQALATCVQQSPERQSVESTEAHAWMSVGKSTARDGDFPETRTERTELPEAPREPQTHSKRQHLLTTRCTSAVRECVARVRSSQAGPVDGSNSAATTSTNGQSVEVGLRATWSEIEPAAIHSARAAPLPTTHVAAKPAATSDQVRATTCASCLCH